MPRRILHIITDLDCGGAESMLVRLCSQYDPGAIAVLSLKVPGVFEAELRKSGIPVYSLRMESRFLSPVHLLRLRRVLREVQPELYWGWMYHAAFVACIAARMQPAPIIWNVRQTLYDISHERIGTRLVLYALRWLQHVPEQVVFNSELSKQQHAAFGFTATARVIPNGFSDAKFFPSNTLRAVARETVGIPPDAIVIGHAARYHPMKDHRSFFLALQPLLVECPDLFVLCCGAGVSADCLPETTLKDRFRFGDVQKDMNLFYNALDVFCMSSSRGEGFPNVLAEALLTGIYSVATDVGSAREVLADLGLIVPPSDPLALSAALRTAVLAVAEDSESKSAARREHIKQRYSLDAVARQYRAVEQEIQESV